VTRRAVAEALGTALVLAAVLGSSIMGEQLAGGNVVTTLLANTIATGAALVLDSHLRTEFRSTLQPSRNAGFRTSSSTFFQASGCIPRPLAG
jgi:hypothetical protein